MAASIGRGFSAAFAVALGLIIANGIVSFKAVQTLIDSDKRVVHSLDILEDVAILRTMLSDAESSQRGFLVMGNEDYLKGYNESRGTLDSEITRLRELTSDNIVQQTHIGELEPMIAERLRVLAAGIEMRRGDGLDAVINSKILDGGRERMAEVRNKLLQIEVEEKRLLAVRSTDSELSGRNAVLTFVIANALLFGLLGLVYFFLARYTRERNRIEGMMREANDRLETRVIERTAELADTNTELERSNRELQDFAFVASHDLQEPLRKIQAFGDRLNTKHGPQLNDEARDYLQRMQGAAGRMHTLINDLLTFSRVTTKAQPFVPTDLNQIARDVLADLEVRVQDSGGRVDLGHLPTIDADPTQMRQLLQNLIGNALKFHRKDVPPIIKIAGTVPADGGNGAEKAGDDRFRLTIEDNGIGFEEKYLDRIFTPFQRLHGRGEYEGTGIGLAVCRKIVERHGGTLTATSTPGEGSTFIANLPVNQEKETP